MHRFPIGDDKALSHIYPPSPLNYYHHGTGSDFQSHHTWGSPYLCRTTTEHMGTRYERMSNSTSSTCSGRPHILDISCNLRCCRTRVCTTPTEPLHGSHASSSPVLWMIRGKIPTIRLRHLRSHRAFSSVGPISGSSMT